MNRLSSYFCFAMSFIAYIKSFTQWHCMLTALLLLGIGLMFHESYLDEKKDRARKLKEAQKDKGNCGEE